MPNGLSSVSVSLKENKIHSTLDVGRELVPIQRECRTFIFFHYSIGTSYYAEPNDFDLAMRTRFLHFNKKGANDAQKI